MRAQVRKSFDNVAHAQTVACKTTTHRNCLQCFAETHLISQNGADAYTKETVITYFNPKP